MAKDFSFDVVSQVEMQALDDAVNTAMKEINNRYDLKGQNITIELNRAEETVTFNAPSDFQLNMAKDILKQKFIKRGVDVKALTEKSKEQASGGSVREIDSVASGIDKETAKQMVKDIKSEKIKVQVSIQDEQLRVSSAKKDDLQAAINFIKGKNYPLPLQFVNYR